MNHAMLVWMVLVPTAAGGLAFLCPRRTTWLAQALTIGVSGFLLVTATRLFGQAGLSYRWVWLTSGSLTLALDLTVTQFGSVIALLIAAFGTLVSVYVVAFTKHRVGRHHAYMLWTLAGGIGAALAGNLIVLLLCWDVTTLMLFLLIGLGGDKAKAAASKTFSLLGFADCALLLAVVLLMFGFDEPKLLLSELRLTVSGSPLAAASYLLVLVAALAKAGAMPFHTWIPAAADGAPTDVMAFLPASLDKLLGIYLLARATLEFFRIGPTLQMLLMIIGALTILGAVMMALIQHDLKKLLSFHAISQVGYMVLGIGTGSLIGVAGALFHMINNAIYKSCLFLVAGSVERQTGTTNLDRLGGLARFMPWSFAACIVAALAISGVPPMNGFTSKWLVYQAALDPSLGWVSTLLVAAAVFGSALTLASFIKVIHSVFLGSPSPEIVENPTTESPVWMTAPMLVLALACIVFGIFAALPLASLVVPALETLQMPHLQEQLTAGKISALGTIWDPVLATALLLLAFVLGLGLYALGSGFRVRQTRTYVGGEVLPASTGHYSGTGFYNSIRTLPGIRAIFRDAQRESFDLYRLTGRLGGSLVDTLRRCQTGVLPLYISWVLLGLVVIVVYLVGRPPGPP